MKIFLPHYPRPPFDLYYTSMQPILYNIVLTFFPETYFKLHHRENNCINCCLWDLKERNWCLAFPFECFLKSILFPHGKFMGEVGNNKNWLAEEWYPGGHSIWLSSLERLNKKWLNQESPGTTYILSSLHIGYWKNKESWHCSVSFSSIGLWWLEWITEGVFSSSEGIGVQSLNQRLLLLLSIWNPAWGTCKHYRLKSKPPDITYFLIFPQADSQHLSICCSDNWKVYLQDYQHCLLFFVEVEIYEF